MLSVALDYRGERTRASLDIMHVSQRIDNEVRQFQIAPTLASLPSAPSDTSLNYPGYGRIIMHDTSVVGRVEHDIADNITVHAALGNRKHKLDAVAGNATLTSMDGGYVSTPAWQKFEPDTTSFETGLTAKFATDAVKHNVVASFSRMTNDADIGFVFPWGYASIPNNLYTPIAPPSDYHQCRPPTQTTFRGTGQGPQTRDQHCVSIYRAARKQCLGTGRTVGCAPAARRYRSGGHLCRACKAAQGERFSRNLR